MLMPVFNAAPYIAEAVESVRAQTLDKWELIIVDDGSVDKFLRDRPPLCRTRAPMGTASSNTPIAPTMD